MNIRSKEDKPNQSDIYPTARQDNSLFFAHLPSFVSQQSEADTIKESFMERKKTTSSRTSSFTHFLWNSNSKTYCGRTFRQWGLLLFFYLFFYGVLAALFAVCFGVFMYAVVMRDFPVRTGDQSTLHLNPALGMVPQPDHYTSLISFRNSKKYSYRKYVDELVAFTQWYEKHGGEKKGAISTGKGTEGILNCAESGMRTSDDYRRVCGFNLDVGGRCNLGWEFGYEDGTPCVILKLNRVYGWLPDPVDNTSHVQVSCDGISDIDKDLIGPICYHDEDDYNNPNQCNKPYGEFKSYYFPYLRQINYQSPLVFVEFQRPQRYTIIRIECRVVAKNVRVDVARQEGSIRFELLVY